MFVSKKIASDVVLFGLFWICIFGQWHTVNARGDDSSIYLVDFDETAYDLYLKGYYPTDYTYSDFRRDSIEGMVSHYVATDSNNFSAIVDSIEQDVLLNGWSVIDNFFENSWIDLKSGVVTVAEGFTDDFKHTLDGRFKTSGASSGSQITIGSGHWVVGLPFTLHTDWPSTKTWNGKTISAEVYFTWVSTKEMLVCSRSSSSGQIFYNTAGNNYVPLNTFYNGTNSGYYGYFSGGYGTMEYMGSLTSSQYGSRNAALADFYNNALPSSEPSWNGDGYYSDTPTDYSINLPALPAVDWPSISNNNKTKYGVDFPDVDLTIDFQLPDSYYPRSVSYDTPYWLYNTDSTPVDWANVSFEDVSLPEVQLSDGDGTFFQALFNTLPLAFVPIFLGVILCYLIFLML